MNSTNAVFYGCSFETSFGRFSLAVDDAGAVAFAGFCPLDDFKRRAPRARWLEDEARTSAARAEVLAYCADGRRALTLKVAPRGTAFQQRVWSALKEIPRGETRSYGELAKILHSSPRAVGGANATNPVCLIIPCHRVIGAGGRLTGYAFGEELKRRLLEHEGACERCAPPRQRLSA